MLFNAVQFQQLWQKNNIDGIELSAKPQWIKGEVLSLHVAKSQPKKADESVGLVQEHLRFNFNVTHLNQQKLPSAIKIRLSWKKASLVLQQGQIALLKVKFKPAHGLANLGSFSYQTWLNSQTISATGYVVNHKNNHIIQAQNTRRQKLFNDYKNLLSQFEQEYEITPILLALGFGSRAELNAKSWTILQATGTGHLIAISGLHIGLVATASYLLVMRFISILPLQLFSSSVALQTVNGRYVAIGFSILVAAFYGYLAGFSLPTIRALLMLNLYWLVRLLAIKLSLKRWLLLTLFLLTLMTPFSLFTASFWLSVYAVIVIFLTLWRFKSAISSGGKIWRFIKGLVVIQLSLTLMLLPISAVFFQQISLVALLANIIAVPWMSFVCIPLCLLSVLLMPIAENLSQLCLSLCLESVQVLWVYLSYLSRLPFAIIELSTGHVQLMVVIGGLSFLIFFTQFRLTFFNAGSLVRRLFLCCCLILCTAWSITKLTNANSASIKANTDINVDSWQLVVFDVGQGLSVLIEKDNKAILYDTGAAYSSGFNMVEAVILPYLQHENIRQLDKVIISHSDNDHAGGLGVLQQSINIAELIYNKVDMEGVSACQQGQSYSWHGLTFAMLWPHQALGKENDDSCVLLISDGKHQVLLTGDISRKVEEKLLKQYPSLNADILIVPHHGSKTSSSNNFIKQINPKLAVVSAGFLNRWHMPVESVVQRYQANNIELLNTAVTGQILINFSASEVNIRTYQHDLWPFWFANTLWPR